MKFNEARYLAGNPDVAQAVAAGQIASGQQHYEIWGKDEGRQPCFSPSVEERRQKMERVAPLLDLERPHVRRGTKYDFLTEQIRAETRIVDTSAVSANPYDPVTVATISDNPDWLILDCGAGSREEYHLNVVNYEIVDYVSTDVIGVGEYLPFLDGSFDAVLSHAVLEHVRDPFRCAREIARVLKPGGKLLCSVPFLAPLHGYPHHYYNMSGQGLRALFEDMLTIEQQTVPNYLTPVWWLTWALSSWARGLPKRARAEFEATRVGDLLKAPNLYEDRSWVRDLPEAQNFELAAGTYIVASKR